MDTTNDLDVFEQADQAFNHLDKALEAAKVIGLEHGSELRFAINSARVEALRIMEDYNKRTMIELGYDPDDIK